mgnify:CR=1 FL=1
MPGQSLELWRQTLQRAVALETKHLSTYGLTFEKGTSFWTRRSKGQLIEADNELELSMYEASMQQLAEAGFEQYEISNFARSGYASRHNQVYWSGLPYWGFGPGAASYLDGERRLNHRSTTTWIQRVLGGGSFIYETERLDPEDRARELIVLRLRTTAGVNRAEFRTDSGFELDELVESELLQLVKRNLVTDDGDVVKLTHDGKCLADSVAGELLRV